MDTAWLDILFPQRFSVLSQLQKTDREGNDWEGVPDRLQCGNVYLYNLRGEIVGERQNCVTHDTLVGTNVSDWFDLDPRIEKAWRTAVSGMTGAWIGRLDGGKNLFVLNLYPYAPLPTSKPIAIIGLLTAVDEETLDWLADKGMPVVPH